MTRPGSQPEYLQPYLKAVKNAGAGFDATLWSSREGQLRRFDVLLDLADVDGGSILDLGCGIGDLARHLLVKSVPFSKYVGIDAVKEMIDVASEVDDPRCGFLVADPVRDPSCLERAAADWIFISGTLNAMDEDLARSLVDRAFEAAGVGVVFNFLSNRPHSRWNERDLTPARRFDTTGWIDWAMSRTPLVRFSQAYYDGHDASISMRRCSA